MTALEISAERSAQERMATKDFEKDISQQTGTYRNVLPKVRVAVFTEIYAAVQKKTFTKWVNSHLSKVVHA